MYCSKCGKFFEGNQTICPDCLAAQQAPNRPQQPPVGQPVQQPVIPTVQPPVQQPVYQAPQPPVYQPAPVETMDLTGEFNVPSQPAPQAPAVPVQPQAPAMNLNLNLTPEAPKEPKQPKKANKKLITSCIAIVAAIAVLISAFGFIFWDFGAKLAFSFVKLTKSEQQTALYVEERAMEQNGVFLASDLYGAMVSSQGVNHAETSMTLEMGDPLLDLLTQYLPSGTGVDMAALLEAFQNITITMDSNTDGEASQNNITLALGGVDIMTVSTILEIFSGNMMIGLPDMSDTYVSIDMSDSGYDAAQMQAMMAAAQELIASLPSEEDFNQLLAKYILLGLGEIKNVGEETETIEVEGVKQTFTVYTYRIDADTAREMLIAILEEAQYDDELYELLSAFCDYYNNYAEILYGEYSSYYTVDVDDIFDNIPYLIETLEENDYSDGTSIRIETFVDDCGDICGRSVKLPDDGELFFLTTSSGAKRGFEFSAGDSYDSISVYGSGKELGNKLTGEYILNVYGEEILEISLTDFNTENNTGTISLGLGDDAKALLEEELEYYDLPSSLATLLSGADIHLDIVLGETTADMKLMLGSETFLAVNFSYVTSNDGTVTYPSTTISSDNYEAMEQWAADLDLNVLFTNLENAGVPDAIIDMLRSYTG